MYVNKYVTKYVINMIKIKNVFRIIDYYVIRVKKNNWYTNMILVYTNNIIFCITLVCK